MQFDFLMDAEPFEKLVAGYVESGQFGKDETKEQRTKREVMLLNSILVQLVNQAKGIERLLTEAKYVLQVNSDDRTCLQRTAQLFTEVARRSPYLIAQTPPPILLQLLHLSTEKAFITVCGNDFISLLDHLSSQLDLASQSNKQAVDLLFNFITANKLQVVSYRQETRLALYRITLRLLSIHSQLPQNQESRDRLLQRCVGSGDGEKDPRNIGKVFEIYLKINSIYSEESLLPYKTGMFQNLQAYYPIEFVGDEDNKQHKKVNLKEITGLLDECLCLPLFSELTWELLAAKTAAPPIVKFIPTLLLYLEKRRLEGNGQFGKLRNLLFRFSEQAYIQEDYEDIKEDLGQVIVKLLDLLACRSDGSMSSKAYTSVLEWIEMMVERVVGGDCHHSGALMCIFRAIINRRQSRFVTLIEMFRCYSIRTLVKVISVGTQMVPKLGLAIVALSSIRQVSTTLNELLGLFVLKMGTLYQSVTDELKMLLLKSLLEIYRSCPSNRAMIRKANDQFILKDCLARAKQSFSLSLTATQAFMIKAFVDFVSVVYVGETENILDTVDGGGMELEGYLLVRMWQAVEADKQLEKRQGKQEKIAVRMGKLIDEVVGEEEREGLLKSLKMLTGEEFDSLMRVVKWGKKAETFDLLVKLQNYFQSYYEQQVETAQMQPITSPVQAFFLNPFPTDPTTSRYQQLWSSISNQPLIFPLLSQSNTQIPLHSQYFAAYPPTFVHWQWQHLTPDHPSYRQTVSQLLKHLPERLLLRDSKRIVELLLADKTLASSLLKIARHMQPAVIRETGIDQFCLNYLKQLPNDLTASTENSTCILAMAIDFCERDEEDSWKPQLLREAKLLKKLSQHKKRPIRQAARKLQSLLQ